MDVVRANGLEIAYERAGAGPALVFAHGAASDSRLWRPQLAALVDEFTVVAWDEPGADGTARACNEDSHRVITLGISQGQELAASAQD